VKKSGIRKEIKNYINDERRNESIVRERIKEIIKRFYVEKYMLEIMNWMLIMMK
jgi:hypothetical protein